MKRNYVIINNIDSLTIPGLAINELPPITKPPIRSYIEEIDGRDGDIITNLGYASYDKTMTIGLYDKYDIDDIITFFNGEGTIVFSNEPDKYYIFKILEQIDYEQLLKFRTATITFHCQPFKYALHEEPFIKNITNETSMKVSNIGYIESKPIIKLIGTGLISLSVNGNLVFTINIDDDWVTIDSIIQEAHKNNILKNRKMNGNFPKLKPGINVISWTGALTQIKVEPKSRWL